MIRVAIIAPAVAVRVGLRALLSDEPRIQVISEGAYPLELDRYQLDADVVVWSPESGSEQMNFQQQLNTLKIGETAALLLIHNDPKVIRQLSALSVSAWGVLDPEATQAELVASILAMNEGLVVANPVWLKQALTNHAPTADDDYGLVEPLTERELEILQLLAVGLTNKQIAAKLKISAHTVKFHVSSIYDKLGTTNRVETVNLGLKKGLIVL